MKRILCVMALLLTLLAGAAEDTLVPATGMGPTYRAAVNEALISALEQHGGVTLSATERSDVFSSETGVSVNGAEEDRTVVNDSITKGLTKWAKGKISGYTVTDERFDSLTKKYHVTLTVRFPGPYIVGLDPDNRRRLAVATLRVKSSSFSWYGQKGDAADWAEALTAKLSERFTRTRKFTVLDRRFDTETRAELARLNETSIRPGECIRLGQKLGTDYLVVGEVAFFPVVAPGVNPLTGQPLPQTSAPFAEISYRVILAPTGQIKWADTVKVDALECAASEIGAFASRSAEMASVLMCDATLAAILPFEIVAKTGAGQLVIGEGGKSLVPGEVLAVYALGEVVKDSRTGEELDAIEEEVGKLKIVRVTEKLSYAVPVAGEAAKMKAGCVVRRIPAAPAAPAAPPMTTTIKGNGTGGVVTPF